MLIVRDALESDLPAVLAIYNDVVATTTAVYRDDPATLDDRVAWWRDRVAQRFPVLVAVAGDQVVGFASFGDFRAWPGYRFTVEHSVHVRDDWRGRAGVHLAVADAETISMLERQLTGGTPRQAAYALGMLAEAAQYEVAPLLDRLVDSPATEVRRKVYEVAAATRYEGLRDKALGALAGRVDLQEQKSALTYLGTNSEDNLITAEWVTLAAGDTDPQRRALAALAIQLRGIDDQDHLRKLLEDADKSVAEASCRAAGVLGDRRHFDALIRRLNDHAVRGTATESLACFGPKIVGALGDILTDPKAAMAARLRIPRVLRLIRDQRSVDVLMSAISTQDDNLSLAILKALNRLRESAPSLEFKKELVAGQITEQAKRYFDLGMKLDPLRGQKISRTAASLLVKSMEERMARIEDRLFRLLALRYPPVEMYNAYLAVRSRKQEKVTTAVEYLDSTLDRDWKRYIVPLFEAPERVAKNGKALFGMEMQTTETAVRALVGSGDVWLTACAMATAGELKLRAVLPEIERAQKLSGPQNAAVAQSAIASLA